MIIDWSKRSKVVYLKFIDQTLENFSVKLAKEFIDDVDELIGRIKSDKELCPPSKIKNLRRCVVNVNISMIYKHTSTKIEIVTFLFNRCDHKY